MAIAVDQGSLYFERRETQALADLAAIAGAAASGDPASAVLATLADNGLSATLVARLADTETVTRAARVAVETGHYEPDPSRSASTRFVVGAARPTPCASASPAPGHAISARASSRR